MSNIAAQDGNEPTAGERRVAALTTVLASNRIAHFNERETARVATERPSELCVSPYW